MLKPVVSVLIITYNQERFIAQAVHSALNQQTTFPYEIVIGDDGSTDTTRKILTDLRNQYPDRIKLIFQTKNLKPVRNLMSVYKACKGKFIALLEGDDYWTSPLKLARQVEYLETHPDAAICYHSTTLVNEHGQPMVVLPVPRFKKPISTLTDLIRNGSFMATCSTMFRNKLFGAFPDWFSELTYIADLPLNVLNAQHGKIGYIDQNMAVYRSCSSALAFTSQKLELVYQEHITVFQKLLTHLPQQYTTIIQDHLAQFYFWLAEVQLRQNQAKIAWKQYRSFLQLRSSYSYISLSRELRFLAKFKLVIWLDRIKRMMRNQWSATMYLLSISWVHSKVNQKLHSQRVILGRVSCIGRAIVQLHEADHSYVLVNQQKVRADLWTDWLGSCPRPKANSVSGWIRRPDVYPLIIEQAQLPWLNQRKPSYIVFDSYSELTDKKFTHRNQGWSFAAHYADVALDPDFETEFIGHDLLDVHDLTSAYDRCFADLTHRFPGTPIYFIHASTAHDSRSLYRSRAKTIKKAITSLLPRYSNLHSITVPDSAVNMSDDGLPYHYHPETLRHYQQAWLRLDKALEA